MILSAHLVHVVRGQHLRLSQLRSSGITASGLRILSFKGVGIQVVVPGLWVSEFQKPKP